MMTEKEILSWLRKQARAHEKKIEDYKKLREEDKRGFWTTEIALDIKYHDGARKAYLSAANKIGGDK